jgi:protein ImuB
VTLLDEAVLMEVEASVRLFGGKRALRDRVVDEARDLGVVALAWAPTALAALALARSGIESGFRKPLAELLDPLPMASVSALRPHEPVLARLGCRSLGDVRRLPRGGISRRFDAALLAALDQAYGQAPEVHEWLELPETFEARLELMSRVEMAPALLFGARRLLLQMCGWLAARHCGCTALRLRWAHDTLRARSAGEGGDLLLRTAAPTRDLEHLCRLLAEHLAKIELLAPVGELSLAAVEVVPIAPPSESFLPDPARSGETLQLVLERLAARLGPERVLRPVLLADHRLEWMQHWQPAPLPRPKSGPAPVDLPQPSWVLAQPLRLATRAHRPIYQGVLHLLTGPHRVEGGWWHRFEAVDTGAIGPVPPAFGGQSTSGSVAAGPAAAKPGGVEPVAVSAATASVSPASLSTAHTTAAPLVAREPVTGHVQRDYWVALSEHAGVLWVFQERLADDDTAWYLHGVFA